MQINPLLPSSGHTDTQQGSQSLETVSSWPVSSKLECFGGGGKEQLYVSVYAAVPDCSTEKKTGFEKFLKKMWVSHASF